MAGRVPDPLIIATQDGDLTIDFARQGVTANGAALRLTPIERDILLCLASHYGTVVPVEELVEAVWGERYGQRGHVSVHVHHLRRKLGTFGSLVVNERGVGYALEAPARKLALPSNWPDDLPVLFSMLGEDAAARGVMWIFVERNFTIAWASDSVSDLLGWQPGEMVGREPRDFILADDVPRFLANFPASHGPSRVQFDTLARHQDGSLVPIRIEANVFYQSDGSRLAGIGEWSLRP
ncbi:MAG: winged helix-turn-helix domain-containing protein [bacterium]